MDIFDGLVKICGKCKEEKPLSAFYRRGKRGYQTWCKVCQNYKRARNYFREHPEILTKICRECSEEKSINDFYRDKRNYDGKRSKCKMCDTTMRDLYKKSNLKANYGITPEQYGEMKKKQNGNCLICLRPPANGDSLAVDHNHESGKVRGLLCRSCNRFLGWIENDLERADRALAYLKISNLI